MRTVADITPPMGYRLTTSSRRQGHDPGRSQGLRGLGGDPRDVGIYGNIYSHDRIRPERTSRYPESQRRLGYPGARFRRYITGRITVSPRSKTPTRALGGRFHPHSLGLYG